MLDPIHTTESDVHALHVYLPTYLHSSAQRNSIYTNVPHYYALMRAGYVLYSLECLECRVVGKCCSNVLRSVIAYGVSPKAVRTYVCEEATCVAHDVRSHTYNRERCHIHPYQIQTRVHALHVYLPTFIPVRTTQ
jgi:hypothetical protein